MFADTIHTQYKSKMVVIEWLTFLKFRVFWDVAQCSDVEVDYTALHPRSLNIILATVRTCNFAWLTLLFGVREVPDSNLDPEIGYP
jgi:hypothetical protein